MLDQLDCLKYVKNYLKNERNTTKYETLYNKLIDLITRFEDVISNERNSLNTLIIEIGEKKILDINEALRNRYDETRTNYNKILANLGKMLDSNPEIANIKEAYWSERNKNTKSSTMKRGRTDSMDEKRSKITESNYNITDTSNKQHLDTLEQQISNLYKTAEKTHYKGPKANVPTKKPSSLSKTHSATNISISKDDKLKNIKTFHNEKVYFQNLQSFLTELEHIKDFCRNLQKTQQENCILASERKNFENMKSDVIKISSDVNILKDEFQEIHNIFKQINARIDLLEDENNNLKIQNKKLVNSIKQNDRRNDYISIEDEGSHQRRQFIPEIESNNEFIPSHSPYLGNTNNERMQASNTNFRNNNQKQSIEEVGNNSVFSDLLSMQNNSSIEMNMNLKNASVNNMNSMNNNNISSKRRFLIPK